MELKWLYHNVDFVRMEEFLSETMRFTLLTSNYIFENPDFEEEKGEGVYKLRIARVELYNGTRYRCHGFDEHFLPVVSNEWTLVVPGEFIS